MRAQRGGGWNLGSDLVGLLMNGCLAGKASSGRAAVQQNIGRQES